MVLSETRGLNGFLRLILHYLARYTHRVAISNEPPYCRGQRIPSALPLERIRPPQQTAHHASDLRRIPAPLPAARPPERLSAYSLLRLDGQSPTEQTASALSRSSPAPGAANFCRACTHTLAMPSLPCTRGGPGTIHTQRAFRYRREAGIHP